MNDRTAITEGVISLRIDGLIDQYLSSVREGNSIDVDRFASQHPDVEQELREMLHTILAVERLHASACGEGSSASSNSGVPLPAMDDYRILRVVGRGGMGIVFEAVQKSLDRRVALKVLPQSMLRNQQARERFQFEARTAARLHHTNIVPIHEFGFYEDTCFFTMQFIDGQALDEVIADLKRIRSGAALSGSQNPASVLNAFSLAAGADTTSKTSHYAYESQESGPRCTTETTVNGRSQVTLDTVSGPLGQQSSWSSSPGYPPYFINVARFAKQAAEALAYAHEHGVIHRDIKPSNLILDQDWKLWITDFGLAKSDETTDLTREGDVVGTLRYMSPERFEGKCTTQSDIYALGTTLYELIALQPAYQADDRMRLIDQVKVGNPPKLRSLDRKVPYDLQTIVEKAMAAAPGRRYTTAAAMADDLERFLAGRPILARRVGNLERFWLWSKKNRSLAAALATVMVLLLLGTIGSTFAAVVFQGQSTTNAILAAQKVAESKEAKTQRDLAQLNAYFADMRQAVDDWENGHVRRMMTTLREYVPREGTADLRGWEWYYLLSLPNQNVSSITDFPGVALQVSWSPDGQKLASLGSDGTLRIWNASDASLIRKIEIPGLSSFAFGPEGKQLVTVSSDAVLRLWNVDTGRMIGTHKTEFSELNLVDWNHATNRIALGGVHPDNQVVVVDAENFQQVIGHFNWFHPEQYLTSGDAAPNLLRLSPDGEKLFVSYPHGFCVYEIDGTIVNRSIDRGSLVAEEEEFRDCQPMSVAWHPDSRRYLVGTYIQGTLLCEINKESRDPKFLRRIGSGSVDAAAVSRDGQRIYLGDRGQRIQVWELDAGSPAQTHRGHAGAVISLALQPQGESLASSSLDGSIRIWNLTGNAAASSATKKIFGSGVSSDGRWSWRQEASTVTVFDEANGNHLISLIGFELDGTPLKVAAQFFPSVDRALFWESEIPHGPRHIQVVDTNAWKVLEKRRAYSVGRNWASVAGNFAVDRVGETGSLWLFNGTSGKTSIFQAHDSGCPYIALSPNGKQLASAWLGEVKLWDTQSQTELASFYGHRPGGYMPWICWGNTGRFFATASIDRTVRIWDAERRTLARTLQGLQGTPAQSYFGFSSDDRLFVACDSSNHKVWHVESGRELLSVPNENAALIRRQFASTNAIAGFDFSDSELSFQALAKAEELAENKAQVEQFEHESQHALAGALIKSPGSRAFAPERAVRYCQRALELNPTNPQYLSTLALAQYYTQSFADALATLKLAADSGADPLFVELLRTNCFRQLDRKQEALVSIGQAATLFEASSDISRTSRRLSKSTFRSFFQDKHGQKLKASVVVNTLQDELNGIDDGQVSLREAVMLAAEGGEIRFEVTGTIRLRIGAIEIDKSLQLVGPGAEQLTIDAGGQSQIFRIRDGNGETFSEVSISGLHLTRGASPNEEGAPAGSWGGAIQCFESLTMMDCLLDYNDGGHTGGAVLVWDGGQIAIQHCRFVSNSATVGGAIQIAGTDAAKLQTTLLVHACTFQRNTSRYGGAAIRTGSGDDRMRVVNSTFAENIVTWSNAHTGGINGGGAIIANSRQTMIDHCTFTNNQGGAVFSGLYSEVWNMEGLPQLTITNSILSGNQGVDGTPLDLNSDGKVLANVSHCILGEVTNGFRDAGNNLRGVDALLGPLADNGGPTPTVALLPGSPAIDAASVSEASDPILKFDQRGASYLRSVDGDQDGKLIPDIGAFESSPE